MSQSDDLRRLRMEYADRARRLAGSDLYSCFNPAHLFMIQMRQREELKLLQSRGFSQLAEKQILEIGSGRGEILLQYLQYGAGQMAGIELLPERAAEAHQALPGQAIHIGDAQSLPYPTGYFDLVMQYTVFSSILDPGIRENIAREMLRVIRKRAGMILWYDFWLNPTNPQTRGVRPGEIRQLFPGCRFEFHKITLAPPITRRLIPGAWGLALLLESLKLFNSHYLVAIQPL